MPFENLIKGVNIQCLVHNFASVPCSVCDPLSSEAGPHLHDSYSRHLSHSHDGNLSGTTVESHQMQTYDFALHLGNIIVHSLTSLSGDAKLEVFLT